MDTSSRYMLKYCALCVRIRRMSLLTTCMKATDQAAVLLYAMLTWTWPTGCMHAALLSKRQMYFSHCEKLTGIVLRNDALQRLLQQ